MIFNQGYYHALDSTPLQRNSDGDWVEAPIELTSGESPMDFNLGPQEIGTSANPFQHQLQALNAKIKEGASKVEFVFFGSGKGQRERSTPESFDKEERQEMRDLARINEVSTTTHATVAVSGLAGFDQNQGFQEKTRDQAINEVEKAIDFAADASTGGAIVVHTGEWERPIYDHHKKDVVNGETFEFIQYEGEDERAPIMVVDGRNGELRAMRKDTPVYEPKFKTVEDYERETGKRLVGRQDSRGYVYEEGDWIGVSGEVIKKNWEFDESKTNEMFKRVPEFNKDLTNFKAERRDWNYFKKRADEWNKSNPEKQLTPEEIFAKTQYMNQVLQAKGSSLYHARYYEREKETRDAWLDALKFYEKLEDSLPEEEKRRLMIQEGYFTNDQGLLPSRNVKITDYIRKQIKNQEDSMRYTHEASASADVQATQAAEAMNSIKTVHEYGIEKSAESLAKLGIQAWQKYEANKKDLDNPLYIAPENWHPSQYGSHPDELINLVEQGRKKIVEKLAPSLGKDRATEIAKQSIKTTFDTGHLNLWKSNMRRKEDENGIPIESDEEFDKRFAKWAVGKVKKMHKAGILGHVHLTDNMGWDDEHMNIGKGNAPIKEIVGYLKDQGYNDFIVEAGSFNAQNVLPEAWSTFGSPIYSVGSQTQRFSQVHKGHFGYDAPPLYIVGSYSPSNEWKLWSEIPLE